MGMKWLRSMLGRVSDAAPIILCVNWYSVELLWGALCTCALFLKMDAEALCRHLRA